MSVALPLIGCFVAGFAAAGFLVGPIAGFFILRGAASEAGSICS